jgi:hypothetical protein
MHVADSLPKESFDFDTPENIQANIASARHIWRALLTAL